MSYRFAFSYYRDIILLTNVHLVKAMFFLVVMYRCESWTIKKAECIKIDTFEMWSWRRLLRVHWTARRSNPSILKISPGCSLERLMLKLKLQHFGHLMGRANSLEKTLMLGKIEGGKRKGRQRMIWWMASRTQWTWVCVSFKIAWWSKAWHAAVHGIAKSFIWVSDWTTKNR